MNDFKKQFRGYNKQQVDAELEELANKISRLEDEIVDLQEEVGHLLGQNASLTNRVNITEKTNEEIARLALKEASELIEKAKRNANMILKESLAYVRGLSSEMTEFRDQAVKFRTSVQQMSKDIIDTIDSSEVYNLISEDEIED